MLCFFSVITKFIVINHNRAMNKKNYKNDEHFTDFDIACFVHQFTRKQWTNSTVKKLFDCAHNIKWWKLNWLYWSVTILFSLSFFGFLILFMIVHQITPNLTRNETSIINYIFFHSLSLSLHFITISSPMYMSVSHILYKTCDHHHH